MMNTDTKKLKDFLYNFYVDDSYNYYNFQVKFPHQGKYLIPSDKMETFWKLYQDILYNEDNPMLSILESTRSSDYIPLLADYDIKVEKEDEDSSEFTYNETHVKIIIKMYQDVLRETVEGVTENNLICILLEKPLQELYNEKTDKTIIKRGFHLHFPNIFLFRKSIRDYIIPRIKNKLQQHNVFEDLGIRDSSELCDNCVSSNAWFLYGSKKDDISYPYLVSKIYDVDLEELSLEEAFKDYMIFDMDEHLLNIKDNVRYYLPRILSLVPHNRPTFEIKFGIPSNIKKLSEVEKRQKKFAQNSTSIQEKLKQSSQLLPMLSDERSRIYEDWLNIGFALYCIGEGCVSFRTAQVCFRHFDNSSTVDW